MANAFGYIQLATADLEQARRFYGELFDWRLESTGAEDRPYFEIKAGQDIPIGGMMPAQPQAPSVWVPYVQVDSVRNAVKRADELGATVAVEPTQLPDQSWYSVLADPAGALFALHGPDNQD